MAASINNRRQPEDSEGQHQQQRVRLRSRQRQNQQKQPPGEEVTRIPSQPPEPGLRRTGLLPLALAKRGALQQRAVASKNLSRAALVKLTPPRQLTPQQTEAPARTRPDLRQLRPAPVITPQRLKPRMVRGVPLPQNFDSQKYRTQESRQVREENKLPLSRASERREGNPKSKISNSQAPTSRQSIDAKSNPPTARGGQNPKSIEGGRGRKGRTQTEIPASQPLKPQTDTRTPRQANHRSRVEASIPTVPARTGTSAARPIRKGSASKSSQPQKKRMVRRPQKRPVGLVVYIVRLLILGIGIGALAGTLLSALDPTSQASVKTQDTAKTQVQESPSRAKTSTSVPLTGEIPALKAKVQALAAQNPTLQPGVFIIELDTGAYVDLNSGSSFAAASTIKLPILVAFFRDVDAGKIRLDELLTLKPEMIASGSGDLQYKQAGTKYTALEVATKMIAISDNTATNMLIARLGGAEVLSERFRSWGLTATALRNQLPDVEGTNTTNPKELANLMSIVNQGELVSLGSRDRILDIMQRNEIDTLLPKGLGTGATIAHKTGNIGSLLADVGLVDMPTGKRYIIAVMVKRPFNDNSAQELIRQISRTVYDYFNQPRATPNTTSLPFGKTATYSRAIASETPGN